MSSEPYVPKGTTTDVNYVLDIDPKRAGWTHSSLRIVELAPGGTHTFPTGDSEWILLPLTGACTVRAENEEFHLSGRQSVFASVTDFAYVPRDARAQIASGAGGRFALAGAKCERQLPARYGPAPEVPHARACPPQSPACPATPGRTRPRRAVPETCVFTPGGERPRRPLRTRDHP
jgi:5-deoxy-glucuronate isomerase